MATLRTLAVLALTLFAGCADSGIEAVALTLSDNYFEYCCDPTVPEPPGGIYIGRVQIRNVYGQTVWVEPHVSDAFPGIEVVLPGIGAVTDPIRLEADEVVEFDLYTHVCTKFDQHVYFDAFSHPDATEDDLINNNLDVLVRWSCPEPKPFPYEVLVPCGPGERMKIVYLDGEFGPGRETLNGAPGGAVFCGEDGTVQQRLLVPALNGVGVLRRSVPVAPQLAQAAFASEAIIGYGPSMIAISAWVPANNAMGMIALAGPGDNWTDVVPAGDDGATNLYMAVGFTGRRIARIAPSSLTGQWVFTTPEIVAPAVFNAAWGGPVSACRLERTGDIVTAHEPSLTEPGNLVVVSMGGDDVGDSAAIVGQTGLQPRVLRGLDGILAVTCFGEDKLSIFRKTAAGYEKLGDETVGDGPLGLSVKRLLSGDIAFLSTGSRDDTWSVTIVDPATGAVATTTRAVPTELDEPTDCDWGEGDDAYILGKASGNIARIDSGAE